jgi:uncharacterized protein YggE
MKTRIVLFMLIAAVTVFAFSGCAVRSDGEATSLVTAQDEFKQSKSITVSAKGKVTAAPDVAYITVGITTQNADMQTAQDSNAQIMNAISTALKSAGLSDEDIQTTQYNAYPIYDYSSDTHKIVSYEVNNQVKLTIKDIDRVGEYIDIAVDNGANTTNSISFGILDEQSIYNDALKLAVETAKVKADSLAEAGGVTIIGTMQITENSIGGEVSREYEKAATDEMASGSTPISTGSLDIEASVTVVYEIE